MNKKGFVLMETLVVTVFTLFIFTILYNSVVPLLGKYNELSYYNNLDITYDLYHIKKLINDTSIFDNNYQVLTCDNGTLKNENSECDNLFTLLKIEEDDELIVLNVENKDELLNNDVISDDIKNYLKFIDIQGSIILLQNDGYISYISANYDNLIKESFLNELKNTVCSTDMAYIEEDDIIYVSGDNDCIDFNYVWYSGKLWRITAINPDGTMKMITQDNITVMNWGMSGTVSSEDTTSAYSSSYIREWLNQEFLSTLYNYRNIIVTDYGWKATTDSNAIPVKPTGTTISDAVGLLTAYEYYKSYQTTEAADGYLGIGYYWWLLTSYNNSNVRYVNYEGNIGNISSTSNLGGVRPTVNLKSTVQTIAGTGIKDDPYVLKGDKTEVVAGTTLLNTRSSGEYVKIENDKDTTRLFRIVGTENINGNVTTKLVLNDYIKIKSTGENLLKLFSNDYTYGDGDNVNYWDYYLNNNWINSIDTTKLEKGTYYLGNHSLGSYKGVACSTVNSNVSVRECIKNNETVATKWTGYVGLLRVGEMFSSQLGSGSSSSSNMWLITPYNTSSTRYLYAEGNLSSNLPSTNSYSVRPTINLKSDIVIKSGTGTEKEPFVIAIDTYNISDGESYVSS